MCDAQFFFNNVVPHIASQLIGRVQGTPLGSPPRSLYTDNYYSSCLGVPRPPALALGLASQSRWSRWPPWRRCPPHPSWGRCGNLSWQPLLLTRHYTTLLIFVVT